jgi:hypothetical protein
MDPNELMAAKAELQQELEDLKSDAEYNARREQEEAERAKAIADELKVEVVAAVEQGAPTETLATEASLNEAQGTVTYYHDLKISRQERIEQIQNELEELDAEAERIKAEADRVKAALE